MQVSDWWSQGNCKGLRADVFFPDDDDDEAWYDGPGQDAIRICRSCVVRKQCFEFSLEDTDSIANGVFGGTTPKDRQRYLETVSIRSQHAASGH